ncbi:plasmid replication initiator TrfA [Pseudomonas sp. GV071]|uniref:plasmid replication initiator TrfA n=1 Tax=Pseudomonas sp. GV071 TaxID=2135754 RepID=UPI0021142C8F|nr:plasmid replication initiator TrfA [Pseudomonas sp. GV071]
MTEAPISTCAELKNLSASTHPVRGCLAKIEAMKAKALAMPRAAEPSATVVGGTSRSLPLWPNTDRGVPNIALRSALFGAIAKGARSCFERENIPAQKNITISYTGAQLDQGDLDVWLTVLHLAKNQPIDQECTITASELLQLLQLTDTGANRKTLISRLSRLSACALEVQAGPLIHFEGSLINKFSRDEYSRQLTIRLNPGLHKMFAHDQFTQIHWGVRQTLNGHYLAQWLHAFYSSHAAPFPRKIETLHRLSGSKTTDQSKFRQLLHKALDALGRSSTDHGQPFSYCMEGNLVKIEKTPSKAQRRHLNKRQDEKKIPLLQAGDTVAAGMGYRHSR